MDRNRDLRFFIIWIIWTLLGATFLYGILSSESESSFISMLVKILSLSPLMGFMLALGSTKAATQFNNWLNSNKYSIYILAGGFSFLFALPGLLTLTFNPYTTAIFAFILFVVFGLSKQNRNEKFELNWSDLAIWFILWIPFDFRWYTELHPSFDYNWWSIAISVIAILGWYGYRSAEIGYNLVPKYKDFIVTAISLIMIMIVVIPPGIMTGFLSFSIPESYDLPKLAAHFIGLFLTVALPEELFFRGILLKGLEKVSTKRWLPLVASSLAFGLMHWNNVDGLSMQIVYVTLASIAGLGYGWAYLKSGNNLLAAILTHTLVDWIWKLFLVS